MQGGCYCGEIRYEVTGEPVLRSQCHCRECQYITGGGANFFLLVPNEAFSYTTGAPQDFARTDLEAPVTRQFCPTCGTHLVTRLASRPLTVVKVGTLDDPAGDYGAPQMAIHMADAQPFHLVDADVARFDRLPPTA
ncbi:MAG: GFA family protein [Silicimonas sp.]|nr:GFA family protein [Silicimonas sp.]